MTQMRGTLDPPRTANTFRGYKWLARGAVDPDTGGAWEWSDPDPCFEDERPDMVFGTSIDGLPYQIDDELWEVELSDLMGTTPFPEQMSYGWPEIYAEHEQRVLGARGRLIRRVNVWRPQVARGFAADCVRVARGLALEALGTAGRELRGGGDGVGSAVPAGPAAPEPGTGAAWAERELLVLERTETLMAIWREALLADAFALSHPARAYAAAAAAACAAAAVGSDRDPGPQELLAERAYAEERRRQAAWLRDRLGLPSPGYDTVEDAVVRV